MECWGEDEVYWLPHNSKFHVCLVTSQFIQMNTKRTHGLKVDSWVEKDSRVLPGMWRNYSMFPGVYIGMLPDTTGDH